MLNVLNKKIMKKQAMINILKSKMNKLNKKEDFIKRGRIIWGEFRLKPKIIIKKKSCEKIKRKIYL